MMVDAHSHWLPQEIINNAHFYHKGWGEIEVWLQAMSEQGIGRAVLSYPTSDAYQKLGGHKEEAYLYNNSLSEILRRYPDKFIGAAVLPVGRAEDMLVELRRSAEELGFKAISLASSYDGIYLDDAMFMPLFELAEKKQIPVFVHSQIVNPIGFERVKDPLLTPVIEYVFDTTVCIGKLLMSGLFERYSGLKFIFAYFGGAVPFLADRFDATYQMLREMNFVKDLKGNPTEFLKRIYVDTSGDKTKANLEAALKLFGPGHILWGSDWPAKKDIAGSIGAIRALGISEAEKQGILGGNLEQMLLTS
jgi:predicted TIM-barrel fold metal-dependent hydrolase